MSTQDLGAPHETPQDPVHISEDNAIDIDQAVAIAKEEIVPLGKSTLQRWAQKWKALHNESPVKVVLSISPTKRTYFLDREQFKVWLFDRQQNLRPGEALQDPTGSHETPQDLKRPQETSRGPERFQDEREERSSNESVRELEKKNMSLTIDIEVRNQLLDRARDEIEKGREREATMLRHIGGLEHQLLQLGEAKQHEEIHGTAVESETGTQSNQIDGGETPPATPPLP